MPLKSFISKQAFRRDEYGGQRFCGNDGLLETWRQTDPRYVEDLMSPLTIWLNLDTLIGGDAPPWMALASFFRKFVKFANVMHRQKFNSRQLVLGYIKKNLSK